MSIRMHPPWTKCRLRRGRSLDECTRLLQRHTNRAAQENENGTNSAPVAIYRIRHLGGSEHVVMPPEDFEEAIATSFLSRFDFDPSTCPLEAHELPQVVAPVGTGYRFVFDVDGEEGLSIEDVETRLRELAVASAGAVATVLAECVNLYESGGSPPSYQDILGLTETVVLTRDWSLLNASETRRTKFSAHATVCPPCLTDHVGFNQAAAIVLAADLETGDFPGTVDIGIYGGSKSAQLRAAGVGPTKGAKAMMIPWGRWRQCTGWTRIVHSESVESLRRSAWITRGDGVPIARVLSPLSQKSLEQARAVLNGMGRPAPDVDTMLARTPQWTRKLKSTNAHRIDAQRVAAVICEALARVEPSWKAFRTTRVKIDFESPYDYKFLVSGNTTYCGIKDAAHRNQTGSDKASFVVAMHGSTRPNYVKYRCKHSSCDSKFVRYDLNQKEISAIEVTVF